MQPFIRLCVQSALPVQHVLVAVAVPAPVAIVDGNGAGAGAAMIGPWVPLPLESLPKVDATAAAAAAARANGVLLPQPTQLPGLPAWESAQLLLGGSYGAGDGGQSNKRRRTALTYAAGR